MIQLGHRKQQVDALLPQLAESLVNGEFTLDQVRSFMENRPTPGRSWRIRRVIGTVAFSLLAFMTGGGYAVAALGLITHTASGGDALTAVVAISFFALIVAVIIVWLVFFTALPDDVMGQSTYHRW